MKKEELKKVNEKAVSSVRETPKAGKNYGQVVSEDFTVLKRTSSKTWEVAESADEIEEGQSFIPLLTAKTILPEGSNENPITCSLAFPASMTEQLKKGSYISFNTNEKGFSTLSNKLKSF